VEHDPPCSPAVVSKALRALQEECWKPQEGADTTIDVCRTPGAFSHVSAVARAHMEDISIAMPALCVMRTMAEGLSHGFTMDLPAEEKRFTSDEEIQCMVQVVLDAMARHPSDMDLQGHGGHFLQLIVSLYVMGTQQVGRKECVDSCLITEKLIVKKTSENWVAQTLNRVPVFAEFDTL
jgi:hypothetical protein